MTYNGDAAASNTDVTAAVLGVPSGTANLAIENTTVMFNNTTVNASWTINSSADSTKLNVDVVNSDVTFSKTAGTARTISEELGGTWFEYGIGANFNATKQVHLYADVEAANGGEVDTDYRVNFGVRYSY